MGNVPEKSIAELIGEIENGQFADDLTDEIYKIIAAVKDTRKGGKLKIAITFSPTGRESVEVDASFDATIPEHDRPSTTFFIGKDNTLHRDDPGQPRLPLREVERPANEPISLRRDKNIA